MTEPDDPVPLDPHDERFAEALAGRSVAERARTLAGVSRSAGNQSIARLLQTTVISGITHLVTLDNGDLYREDYESNEFRELEHPDTVTVETDVSNVSRRGPNQEVNSQKDKVSEPRHRWFQTIDVNGQDVGRRDVYLRDDTYLPLAIALERKLIDLGCTQDVIALAPGLIQRITLKTGCPLRDMKLKASSGSGLTVVPSTGGVVYQLLGYKPLFQKVQSFAQSVNFDTKHVGVKGVGPTKARWEYRIGDALAEIREIIPEFNTLVVEKVEPLNALFDEMKEQEGEGSPSIVQFLAANKAKIVFDITSSILGLAKLGYSQADVRLDNIGIKNGKFILFDYDGVKSPSQIDTDLGTLSESFDTKGLEGVNAKDVWALAQGETFKDKLEWLQALDIDRGDW